MNTKNFRTRFRFFDYKWVVLITVLFVVLGAVRQHQYSILYPKSDVFVDPGSGKPNPTWEAYIAPMTSIGPESVLVDLGNMPGDISRQQPLSCLSPLIRMHHEVNEFRVTWNVLYPSYNVDFEFFYNRRTGEVVETQHSHYPDHTIAKTIARNITDRDIHEGAARNLEYPQWAAQH